MLLPGVYLQLSSLQVLVLSYAVVLYPMIVTVIAFTIAELHNCGCKRVMCMWKPFQSFFARFHKEWDLHTTLMHFFIMSTTKLVHVSVSLLVGVTVYAPDHAIVGYYMYEDALVKFFGTDNLPSAILATFVMCFLLFLPISLYIFYSFTCCQRCLTVVRL